jgi:hypothetical protein
MRVWSVDCQAIGFLGLSVTRRKYFPVDSRPASLLATVTERPRKPIALVSVASFPVIDLAEIKINGLELTRRYSQPVNGVELRTMLPPFPTHTKPKQDSSHA